jgi:hypothetical protein
MRDRLKSAATDADRPRAARGRRKLRYLLTIAALAILPASLAAPRSAIAAETATVLRLVQAADAEKPQITIAPMIAASPATQQPLPIRVGGSSPHVLPKNSFLRVRGLPPTVSLSEGYVTGPGAWSVPLNGLSSLQMIVPAGATGRAELSISLVAEDGSLLAEARTVLVVKAPEKAPEPLPSEAAAAPPKPQPPARGPILSPSEREAAEKFVARGEGEVAQGNIAVARQYFLRAAQAGLARGALLLAATHDPRELARWGVHGVQPNLAEARKWYERARELGAPEAEERLARLGAG